MAAAAKVSSLLQRWLTSLRRHPKVNGLLADGARICGHVAEVDIDRGGATVIVKVTDSTVGCVPPGTSAAVKLPPETVDKVRCPDGSKRHIEECGGMLVEFDSQVVVGRPTVAASVVSSRSGDMPRNRKPPRGVSGPTPGITGGAAEPAATRRTGPRSTALTANARARGRLQL